MDTAMQVILIHDLEELRSYVVSLRQRNARIGLVPTMGALHEGHLSLVRRSLQDCGATIVSIFVNPTQFGVGEDFDRYPRNLETDIALLETVKSPACPMVTSNQPPLCVFVPSVHDMYPDGFSTTIDVDGNVNPAKRGVSTLLEGAIRPGHFRGVATVVAKLLLLSRADVAFFGQKDLQQFAVIHKMVRDLNFPTELCCCPIVRETDGLAMSSRNRYLSAAQREAAVCLFQSLEQAKNFIVSSPTSQKSVEEIRNIIRTHIAGAAPEAVLDYVAVVDRDTFEELTVVNPPTNASGSPLAVLIAVRFGNTRLIDNVVITSSS